MHFMLPHYPAAVGATVGATVNAMVSETVSVPAVRLLVR